MNLQEVIKNKQPIDVYLNNEYYDRFHYNEKENIYQGQFGFMDMDTISKVLLHNNEVSHITIKGAIC